MNKPKGQLKNCLKNWKHITLKLLGYDKIVLRVTLIEISAHIKKKEGPVPWLSG